LLDDIASSPKPHRLRLWRLFGDYSATIRRLCKWQIAIGSGLHFWRRSHIVTRITFEKPAGMMVLAMF
jgi:hypothetical protein